MNHLIKIFENNHETYKRSDTLALDLLSISIGGLPIVATGGHFDLGNKKLVNLLDGVNPQDAISKAQHDAHANATNNPHSVTKTQVGLSNVDNVQQLPMSYLDTDVALAANSDAKVPSQKAIKAYVDGQIGGTGDFLDSAFRVSDNGDPTKKMAFEVSAIAASTLRTIQMPNTNIDLAHIAALVSLSGVAAASTHLGNFSGAIIPDSSTIKAAIQSLESFIEGMPSPMVYRGLYNATTNTPSLADGVGVNGDVYHISVAGIHDFGNGNIELAVGDKVVYNGATAKYEKWDMTDAVSSVNGLSGAVTIHAINQLSGDVTTAMASGSQGLVATIAALAVTNAKIDNDTITNAKINAAAGIVYSKLALTNSLVNADVAAGAAIAYAKLNLANAILAGDLTTDSVTTPKVQNTAITKDKLNADVAGAGLTGGAGSALAVGAGVAIKVNADDVAVDFAVSKVNDNAGTVTVRQVVYVKSNGNVDKAQANVASLYDFALAVVEDATILTTATGKVTMRRGAIISGFSGLTPGKKQFVSRATAGALTEDLSGFVATEHVYSVGRAISTTELVFDPQYEFEFA